MLVLGEVGGEHLRRYYYQQIDKIWKISDVLTGHRQVWENKGKLGGQTHEEKSQLCLMD